MALTTLAISQASSHLSEKSVKLWMVLFKKSELYLQYATVYGTCDIEDKILELEGTIEARMLNALLKEIDSLGVGEVEIVQRSKEGLRWSQSDERMALIEEAIFIVFGDLSILLGKYADDALAASNGNSTAVSESRQIRCHPISGLALCSCSTISSCNCTNSRWL